MLELRLATLAGMAHVSCDQPSAPHLQSLRTRFATAVSISSQAFELAIDDLLVNLGELTTWPARDADVRWQSDLLRLVEGNAADAAVLESFVIDAGKVAPSQQQLSPDWTAPLTECQSRDTTKLLGLQHGANFSVPGAGKTRVALAVFQTRRTRGEVQKALVVCPKAAFESWQDEVKICFPDGSLQVAVMTGASAPPTDLLLVNYERLPEARSTLIHWLQSQPTLLLLDEAHRMKLGPAGAWGSTCLSLGPYAARRLILTGTPAPNGAKDLENLFGFVWPGQGRAIVGSSLAGRDLRAASNVLRPLYVRTTKEELQLPPVTVAIRRIALPPLHRDLYDALLGQAAGRVRGGERDIEALGRILLYLLMAATTPALLATGASPHEPLPYRIPPLNPPPDSSLGELMRDLPHYELSPKYQEVLSIVTANAALGRKTLVWSTFVRNLKSLEVLLSRFQPALVHGGTVDRAEQLARFRGDAECKVLLSNPATLGEGVNLHQVCHDAVYVDRDFAAGRFLQSLDRIHRLGLAADTRTQVTILIADQTIDELVEQRLAVKLDFMGRVLDDPAVLELADLAEEPSVSAGMDLADVQALMGYLSHHASSK